MRLVPTFDDLASAQHAIDAQHPSLSDDAPATTLANETDGNGRRVLRLTTQQLATLVHSLAVATIASHVDNPALRVPALERALAAGVRLFQQSARDARSLEMRFDLEDPVRPETWQAIAEWQALASELLGPGGACPDVCWHCHVCLEPSPRHCDRCPPEGDCDVEGCAEPGCAPAEGARS